MGRSSLYLQTPSAPAARSYDHHLCFPEGTGDTLEGRQVVQSMETPLVRPYQYSGASGHFHGSLHVGPSFVQESCHCPLRQLARHCLYHQGRGHSGCLISHSERPAVNCAAPYVPSWHGQYEGRCSLIQQAGVRMGVASRNRSRDLLTLGPSQGGSFCV